MMSRQNQELQKALKEHRQCLLRHNVYQSLESLEDLQVFMENHVFAVWDFMSLLRALQTNISCLTVPWLPTGSPAARRLINEFVLEEESGLDQNGKPSCHLELYFQAMTECGADQTKIQELLRHIKSGKSVDAALDLADVHPAVKQFVQNTFRIIQSGKPHVMAAAFTYGREDLIPGMFGHLISDLKSRFPEQLNTFVYYLNRHMQADYEAHTPFALQMVDDLCGNDVEKWQEALEVSRSCIESRIQLWDGIRNQLPSEVEF